MTYPAIPDRRMPYDNDGTVVYYTIGSVNSFAPGPGTALSGSDMIALNGLANANSATPVGPFTSASSICYDQLYFFFPEQREVTAFALVDYPGGAYQVPVIEGSNDSTNGMDGTWETASLASGTPSPWPSAPGAPDLWRAQIKPISFTGAKRVVRIRFGSSDNGNRVYALHFYGQKATGQTPDDVLFLDGLASYAEFASDEDFGDVPLATSSVRTFKVKNASPTHTANTINLQCNDADFAISTDNVTWVTTINIASLASGASSAVMYIRNTSPAVGSRLGPRFARIVATVASYT